MGDQHPSDVGVAHDNTDSPEADHVYLMIKAIDDDKMMIADNQSSVDVPMHVQRGGRDGRTGTVYSSAPEAGIPTRALRHLRLRSGSGKAKAQNSSNTSRAGVKRSQIYRVEIHERRRVLLDEAITCADASVQKRASALGKPWCGARPTWRAPIRPGA